MSLDLELNGPVAWVLLSVPIALLFGVACHALRVRGRHSKAGAQSDVVDASDLAARREPIKFQDNNTVAKVVGQHPGGDDDVVSKTGLVKFRGNLDNTRDLRMHGDGDAGALDTRISALESGRVQEGELGVLYLQLAELRMRDGARSEATDLIRKCIALALKTGDASVHGHARMAMAAAAVDEGDLAGACEHWQLARELFSGAGSDTASHKIGAHMHRCGCPSDWVLTQF